jgi:hypothetical protein
MSAIETNATASTCWQSNEWVFVPDTSHDIAVAPPAGRSDLVAVDTGRLVAASEFRIITGPGHPVPEQLPLRMPGPATYASLLERSAVEYRELWRDLAGR